jgi:malonyl CoA-acyl carrier protein transacylase
LLVNTADFEADCTLSHVCVMQIGLVDIVRAVGIEPDGFVGHSMGELGCSYMDGCWQHTTLAMQP